MEGKDDQTNHLLKKKIWYWYLLSCANKLANVEILHKNDNTAIALNSVKCAKHFLIIHSKTGDIILTVICFLRYVSIK